MAKVIGIDLGTTNSCVAVMEGGEPVVITNAEGDRTTPSVVGFAKDGERLIGKIAKRQAVANHDRTISSIKREMGSDYKVTIGDKSYSPQEISAMVLSKLKADAEAYLGTKVSQAVITVPAYFSDSQRQATKDAGKIAGLEVLRIINEPTAAALAYGLDKEENNNQKVLIYDLGGGTFDVSILELGDGVFEVLATNGNNKLGGDDFDAKIVKYILDDFKSKHNVDLSKDSTAMQRIKEAAENAKIALSNSTSTNISIPFVTMIDGAPQHIDVDLSRAKFDAMTKDLVQATMQPLTKALSDAGLTSSDIAKVILVGGSTRIPAVVEAVKNATGKEPFKGINPDECVAVGAAIQAGVLVGEVKDVLLLDVTPLTLGIETLGGVSTPIIERNTTIPTSKSQIFSTAADNQTAVDIHVVQGERSMAADNKTLGNFQLDGIAPAKRGIPQIEVTFDIDANGIVNVKAVDKATGKAQSVTITASSNLSKEDIDKAVKEAEKFAEEDKKKKELIDEKNNAENVILGTEKFVEENGEKLTEDEKKTITDAVAKAKESLKTAEDVESLKKIQEELTKESSPAFTRIYQEMAQQQGATDAAANAKANDDKKDDTVIDAEPEIK